MNNKKLRVLVVDDEPDLCELACTWIEVLGHEVVSAAAGADALQVLSTQHFDLLFTDVIMPGGINGVMLARQACAQQPGLQVLLASGYARGLLDDQDSDWPLLSKPYRKADLQRALAQIQDNITNKPETT